MRTEGQSLLTDITATGAELRRPIGARRAVPTISTVVVLGATFFAAGTTASARTQVTPREDLRPLLSGTSNDRRVSVEGDLVDRAPVPRMARVIDLAPLSLREWADVFGVSHTTIKHWRDHDASARPKVDRVLGALGEARTRHADLSEWLRSPLPGTALRPLDLLRDERWTAFRGAVRAVAAPTVDVDVEELRRRRHREINWTEPEVPIVAEDT
ncbi:MAG: hypothetical protein AB7G37_13825 [Solirubrobacteraceae bacterium]